jgi:site-specific recombinase XerD
LFEKLNEFLVYLDQKKMLSPGTILSYEYNLKEFLNYFRENNVEIENVTRAIIRDYAILEVLYCTGVRVSELIAININDISIKDKAIVIRDKWRKKRFVFLGQKAARGLGYYLRARPLLLAEGSEEKGVS